MAYELICGRQPFNSGDMIENLSQRLAEEPPPPETFNRTCTPELSAFVLKALRINPDERFQTVDEVLTALELIKAQMTPTLHGAPRQTQAEPQQAYNPAELQFEAETNNFAEAPLQLEIRR